MGANGIIGATPTTFRKVCFKTCSIYFHKKSKIILKIILTLKYFSLYYYIRICLKASFKIGHVKK
jgi:hypothetical protein